MQSVAILGSTGAIGTRALQVIAALDSELSVVALVAGRNMELLAQQVRQFQPKYIGVADHFAKERLLALLGHCDGEIVVGDEGLMLCANYPSDIVLNAVVGARGVRPAVAAVKRGARLALANKECLVAAGDFIIDLARENNAEIVPVDSEHCALHQAMTAGRDSEVQRFILTASGGPFRTRSREELLHVTIDDALRHPNWTMGQKITVDSATMMNKGLEIIEAHHLFQMPYDKIEVLVHPQSIVHSMVEFVDGSVMAQLATHDMRLPIQYALTFPRRRLTSWPRLDFATFSTLTFEAPDYQKFRALSLAEVAGQSGGYAPCVLNAANEIAVGAFLEGRITFLQIVDVVERTLEDSAVGVPRSVDDVLGMDSQARQRAKAILQKG